MKTSSTSGLASRGIHVAEIGHAESLEHGEGTDVIRAGDGSEADAGDLQELLKGEQSEASRADCADA